MFFVTNSLQLVGSADITALFFFYITRNYLVLENIIEEPNNTMIMF